MTDFTLGPGPLTPEFEQVKSDIGIVENGNTATHAIPAGYYVIWKGDLYVAKTDISSGTALSAESNGNLTAKTQGIGAEISLANTAIANKADYAIIANNTNLDTLTTSGLYKSPASISNVQTLSNCPTTFPFTMTIVGAGSSSVSACIQTVMTDDGIWSRRGTSSGFGSWVEYAKKSDRPVTQFSVPMSSSITIAIPNSSVFTIVFTGNSANLCGIAILYSSGSGTVRVSTNSPCSNISLSVSGNTLEIANSNAGSNCSVYFDGLNGKATTLAT